jgi:ElaB/YqjD/DUF883 family membrane-anchored ribosome-binding protein
MQRQNENAGGAGSSGATDAGGLMSMGTPTSDSERFLEDLKMFVNDTEALLRQAKTLSGEAALAVREEFERRLSQARQGYEQARTLAVDHGQQYLDRTETYVRNEPWKAIGVAALVGAIVDVLLARR